MTRLEKATGAALRGTADAVANGRARRRDARSCIFLHIRKRKILYLSFCSLLPKCIWLLVLDSEWSLLSKDIAASRRVRNAN